MIDLIQKPRLQFPYNYPPGVMAPWMWARLKLGLDLYPWQVEALESVGQRIPTSLVAANGSGKTARVIAPLVLWFLDTYGKAGGKVVLTSGSWLQVSTQLAMNIRLHSHALPEFDFFQDRIKVKGTQDDRAIFFSTDHPGRAEGHHALDAQEAPLLIIVDEAKSVPDGIMEAFSRCTYQFLLVASSPGQDSGFFYRSHHEEQNFWHQVKARSVDCPHIPAEKRERDAALYGEGSPIFRSMHLAEFTTADEMVILGKEDLAKALQNQPGHLVGSRVAFCDFAAGGDECALGIKDGNHVFLAGAWREPDTMQSVRRFIQLFESYDLAPSHIFGDEGGMGVVFLDAMREMGWNVNRVNNAAAPEDQEDRKHYADRGSEIWIKGARQIQKGGMRLEIDKATFEQMTSRRLLILPGGKLKAEPKDKMAARGLKSPDRADAIYGAITCSLEMAGALTSVQGIRLPTPAFKQQRNVRF